MAHHVARKRQYLSFGFFVVTTLASGAAAALSPPSNASSAVSPTAPQAPARVAALPHRAGGAQTAGDEPAGTNGSSSKWGFGVSVTHPIASIYMAQLSYSAWSMGDVLPIPIEEPMYSFRTALNPFAAATLATATAAALMRSQ